MKTTHRDDGFVCENCSFAVPKRGGGYCRNHCPKCLYSLHVDLKLPGDRKSECHGLMKPIDVIYNTQKNTYQLKQECKKCKYCFMVSVAKDDDQTEVLRIVKEIAERKMMEI